MAKEKVKTEDCCKPSKRMGNHSVNCGVYGLGFIGALVYFIQNATSFSDGLYGFFKAIFWPAVLIYKALQLLGM